MVQQSSSIPGWDLTGLEQGIISQGYSAYLGTPDNSLVVINAAIEAEYHLSNFVRSELKDYEHNSGMKEPTLIKALLDNGYLVFKKAKY